MTYQPKRVPQYPQNAFPTTNGLPHRGQNLGTVEGVGCWSRICFF